MSGSVLNGDLNISVSYDFSAPVNFNAWHNIKTCFVISAVRLAFTEEEA